MQKMSMFEDLKLASKAVHDAQTEHGALKN